MVGIDDRITVYISAMSGRRVTGTYQNLVDQWSTFRPITAVIIQILTSYKLHSVQRAPASKANSGRG